MQSVAVAGDSQLLDICRSAREGQPVPNLLFGAVHFLLLEGKEHPLNEYYPSLVKQPKLYKDSFGPFKDFCCMYRNEIEQILTCRVVQTNEVRRCAYLYPAFCAVYEKAKRPLALIEIGTSAVLQLLWDQYSYSYGHQHRFGNQESKLHITAEIIGENIPALSPSAPPVTARIGIDLHTIDLHNDEDKLWLNALIWPEHKERRKMFEEAAGCLKETPLDLVNGDGRSLVAEYAHGIPDDNVICIFHTHVANQMTPEMKQQLLQTVKGIGKKRDVFHIYNNIQDRYLHLDCYLGGDESRNTIAETDGHGRWFEWFLEKPFPI